MALSESALRRLATKLGYRVHKSRARTLHSNNKGGYQVVNDRNYVVDGVNYELTLEDLADFLVAQKNKAWDHLDELRKPAQI
jgi:hypothetical protein